MYIYIYIYLRKLAVSETLPRSMCKDSALSKFTKLFSMGNNVHRKHNIISFELPKFSENTWEGPKILLGLNLFLGDSLEIRLIKINGLVF